MDVDESVVRKLMEVCRHPDPAPLYLTPFGYVVVLAPDTFLQVTPPKNEMPPAGQ